MVPTIAGPDEDAIKRARAVAAHVDLSGRGLAVVDWAERGRGEGEAFTRRSTQTDGILSQATTGSYVCRAGCMAKEGDMEAPARAQLVRNQEQTLHEIERLRATLTVAADMLLALEQKLKAQPAGIVFTNAPDGLDDLPAAYCYLLTGAGLRI